LEDQTPSEELALLIGAGETLSNATSVSDAADRIRSIFVPRFADSCVAEFSDGSKPTIELVGGNASPLRDELERRAVATLELWCAKEKLSACTSELEEAVRELEAFAYSVSHDLRSPLRSIMSASMILMEDYADKLDRDAVSELKRASVAAKKMSGIIDDVLEYSRLGRREMRLQRTNISEIASRVGTEVGIPPGVLVVEPDLMVTGDPEMLRMLIQKLLDNSWKFSKGGPSPRIELGAGEGSLFVRDNGIGFDPQYAEKIFAPFERLNGPEYDGNGIGLANARRIVSRHDGKIWADGGPNEGATVFFTVDTPAKSH
jgi:light-regulated signal transduction histidine kinase (bacteriophytochrome)